MAVSRRREPEATTLTLTIPARSVSRKPGAVHPAARKRSPRADSSPRTRPVVASGKALRHYSASRRELRRLKEVLGLTVNSGDDCPAASILKTRLRFKGGTALKRCYFESYRFSEDLDFTLLAGIDLDTIVRELRDIFRSVYNRAGITFEVTEREEERGNTFTFYVSYGGPLPGRSTSPFVGGW